MKHLRHLEAEAIHILREAFACFERPVLLYSAGKDSSVLLHLSQLAFAPGPSPFSLLHVDTGYKFPEMIEFRDQIVQSSGLDLVVEGPQGPPSHPLQQGIGPCCQQLKTNALRRALAQGRHDAAIGGARREEEGSRSKERIISIRDPHGQWEPRRQRPEFWQIYNTQLAPGEHARIFPLSNWTELDIWRYIQQQEIAITSLYFAAKRAVVNRHGLYFDARAFPDLPAQQRQVRYRTLGCMPCTAASPSAAKTLDAIIAELQDNSRSERELRIIDHDPQSSMEKKKRSGYF